MDPVQRHAFVAATIPQFVLLCMFIWTRIYLSGRPLPTSPHPQGEWTAAQHVKGERLHGTGERLTPDPRPRPLAYSREELLATRPSRLGAHTINRLRELGVGYRLPRKRSSRRRKNKQHAGPFPIPVIITHRPTPFPSLDLEPSLYHSLYPSTQPPVLERKRRHDFKNLIYIPRVASPSDFGLKAVLFNARSVGPSCSQKRTEITSYIAEEDVDIFFLTESWIKPRGHESIIADLTPSGYSLKSYPRCSTEKSKKRGADGGGIAIIFKDKFTPLVTFMNKFDFTHESFELVQMSLTCNTELIHFMCIYRSGPTRANNFKLTDSLFFDQFPEFLDYCNTLHGKLCVLGDFNFFFELESNKSASRLRDSLIMYNLEQTVTGPTHKHGHTLDLVIVRPTDAVHKSTEVTRALESDHYSVVVTFDIDPPSPPPVYRNIRMIRAIDRDAFRDDVQAALSGTEQPCTADQFNAALRGALDSHAPLTRRRVTQRRDPSPWFSVLGDELIAAKQARRVEERRKDSTGLTVHLQMYKKAKNFVTFLVQKAKTMFYNSKIAAAKTSKELYKITNKLCGKTKNNHLPTNIPMPMLPNVFSGFFSCKVLDLRKEIDSQLSTPQSLGPKFNGMYFSSFSPVTETDVLNTLKQMSPKTCDLDPLPTSLFLDCIDVVLPFLTKLINDSLTSGIFPDIHKIALVTPLLKKTRPGHQCFKKLSPSI